MVEDKKNKKRTFDQIKQSQNQNKGGMKNGSDGFKKRDNKMM